MSGAEGLAEKLWGGLPNELPDVQGPIYFDTETSGLHPDDGARVSVVSVAWVDWAAGEGGGGGEGVLYYDAWPFAQGRSGKPEGRADAGGKLGLFGAEQLEPHVNLGVAQWRALLRWLGRGGIGLIGHNVKFDLAMTRVGVRGLREGTESRDWGGIDLTDRVLWDTQVAAKELHPLEKSALKGPGSVSDRYFGEGDEEKQALKKWLGPQDNPRYDLVPWDVMYPYAADDARKTARAHLWQADRVECGEVAAGGSSGWYWVNREVRVLKVLAKMERRGVPYDAAGSQAAAQEVQSRQAKLQKGMPYDPTKKASIVEHYFSPAGLDLTPYSVTEKKREPQLTAEVVETMVRDGIPGAEALQAWTKLETARSMWYTPYGLGTGADGRLRTVFRQVASGSSGEGGTRSGRFSVERVNLQAIPHDYRLNGFEVLDGITTPRELIGAAARKLIGFSLWELDLAQAELRVAAMWAECQLMLDAIARGEDLHGLTATALFGVSKGDHGWGPMRQVAKRGNFSLIFGSGWATFQQMVRKETGIALSNSEAQRTVGDWNALYPEFRHAIDAHSKRVEHRVGGIRGVPLANGRVRWFTGWEDTHKAFNQRVQASLAEYGKDWMLSTEAALGDIKLGGRGIGGVEGGLLLVIHDSQVLLLPTARGEDQRLVKMVQQNARDLWAQMFPGVPGDAEVKRWGEG